MRSAVNPGGGRKSDKRVARGVNRVQKVASSETTAGRTGSAKTVGREDPIEPLLEDQRTLPLENITVGLSGFRKIKG